MISQYPKIANLFLTPKIVSCGRLRFSSDTISGFRSFRQLQLPTGLMRNLGQQNILIPTQIQHEAISILRSGKNAMILSETGSGKTLAYLLPIISNIVQVKIEFPSKGKESHMGNSAALLRARSPLALILLPTEPLMMQVSNTIEKLTKDLEIQHQVFVLQKAQNRLPHGVDILLSTPSTLMQMDDDLINNMFYKTRQIVVDEVDWSLSNCFKQKKLHPLGIIDQLKELRYPIDPNQEHDRMDEYLLKNATAPKQFIFTGATLPTGKKSTRQALMTRFRNMEFISSQNFHKPVKTMNQQWIRVDGNSPEEIQMAKHREILNILREENLGNRVLIFANSSAVVDELFATLNDYLYTNPNLMGRMKLSKLHHGMNNEERLANLIDFANDKLTAEKSMASDEIQIENSTEIPSTHILISGDTVSRGFDFKDVSHVIQFDFATNVVNYLHRIGRTARAGNSGEVINLIEPRDEKLAELIETRIESDAESSETDLSGLFSRNRSLRRRLRRQDSRHKQHEENSPQSVEN